MTAYALAQDLLRPVLRVARPRAMRVYAPGSTRPVVARWNIREFSVTTAEDFALLLAHLREMRRTYEVTLYAYTLKYATGSTAPSWRPVPTRQPMPATPAGPPSGPWGARPLSPGTPRGAAAEEVFPCLRKFRHLEH